MLRDLFKGADYFADVGHVARLIAAMALAPFGLYFAAVGLLTPLTVILILVIQRDWNLAAMLLGIGLFHGLIGLPLCWFALRLFRGEKSANEITILPTWLICAFLVLFLAPLSLGMAGAMAVQAYDAAEGGKAGMAVVLAAGSCGFMAGIIRAVPTAFRLAGRRGRES